MSHCIMNSDVAPVAVHSVAAFRLAMTGVLWVCCRYVFMPSYIAGEKGAARRFQDLQSAHHNEFIFISFSFNILQLGCGAR